MPVYLGAATRTPIGKFGGSLKHLSAPELARLALQEALKRSDPNCKAVDFVYLGHARQAGARPNPARQATVFAGLDVSVPAITVNQACASGMTAVIAAAEKITAGRAHSVWAGGTESMSNTPYLLMNARWGYRMGNSVVEDGMSRDGFHCPMADQLMGATVENFIAKTRGISRKVQDEFALRSQTRAEQAWKSGAFSKETFEIAAEGKNPSLNHDEHRRPDTTLKTLSSLTPVFDPSNGTITAGNSSGIADGAAFIHVSDKRWSHTQAELVDYETVALDPKLMGLGPVPAVQNLLKRQGLKINDLAAIELNEAFAAQALACQQDLKIPDDKLNPRGGAIALGHPIGCSGARILVTLIHQLKAGELGLATLCVSGGQGCAMLIKGNL